MRAGKKEAETKCDPFMVVGFPPDKLQAISECSDSLLFIYFFCMQANLYLNSPYISKSNHIKKSPGSVFNKMIKSLENNLYKVFDLMQL